MVWYALKNCVTNLLLFERREFEIRFEPVCLGFVEPLSLHHPFNSLYCFRLLFHKVHPVFVFDGATPALKRSTHIARRRRREAQEVVLKKTAEKLLLNQLKKQVKDHEIIHAAIIIDILS
jgi:hypothetical protein